MQRDQLIQYLNDFLKADTFSDYCPNGLQVEGKNRIQKILTAVSISESAIDAAIKMKADALMVHHGLFWKGDEASITGIKKQRLRKLLQHDINLIAYHLPLDVHPTLGNNVILAEQLDLEVMGPFATNTQVPLGLLTRAKKPLKVKHLKKLIGDQLKRPPLHLAAHDRATIETIALCTGAAHDFIEHAKHAGADAYLSGEVAERTFYLARELNIHYFACGHHATERGGILQLGQHLAKKFKVSVKFFDEDNPV